jgi:uncharacterized membrane protein
MQLDRQETTPAAGRLVRLVPLATAALLLARVPMLSHRAFDPDELEHSHAAWCVFKGMLPYKDFFEHHTPWYYYTLRPFFNWFDVDSSFESAKHFLLFGRGLSFVLTALSILLVASIGRRWTGGRAGVVAALLLAGQPVFLQKTVEMRPDVLALPFFLAALWCLLRGLATRIDSRAARLGWFASGGLGLGAAVMCTQKMLFVLPGMLAGLGIWALSARPRARIVRDTACILAFVAGVCVPGALTWIAFALNHAGGAFIANNFLINAAWKQTPTGQLLKVVETSAPVLVLALLGVGAAVGRGFRAQQRDHGEILLVCTLLGLFAGLLVIPVAQRQYYLMPLPLVCLLAAKGLFSLVDRARERIRPTVLVVSLLGLSVLPVIGLRQSFTSRNDVQLARLREVFESTKPTDLVMDGWQGTGVFRPHAFYYFFIHDELLPMLSPERVDAYLADLESGRVRPALIALDAHLSALGPRFLAFVNSRYVSHDGFLYFRRG